jgi:ABC-type Mn2+/Zn2+ transport system ATPase subunit
MEDPLLRFERLVVGYGGQPVLKDLNAEIARGDSVGLLGANGSGKTTLLKTIAGVLRPLAGDLVFFPKSKRPVIGFVPQRESLDQPFLLSSLEIVLMGACGRIGPGKFLGSGERSRALECLERTGAGLFAQQRFAELSGGQKQRVLIARALMANPDILLLDEPTAGVDSAATKAIADLLLSLNGQGMTIVMVNHDLPVVRRVARRIFWVREGRLEQGDANEMLNATHREELPIE